MAVELYDLEVDIREQKNVATVYPEVVKRIEAIMIKEHTSATIDRFKIKQIGD